MNKLYNGNLSNSDDVHYKYESLFKNAFDCIYVHDFEGNFLEVSDSTVKLFNFSREEILKMNIKDVLLEDQLEIANKRVSDLKSIKNNSDEVIYKIKNKSGETLLIEVRSFLLEKNGMPFAVQGIARDVTKRIKHQEELAHSEENFRLIFEHAADAIVISDREANILDVNKVACEFTLYSREELTKMNIRDLLSEEDKNSFPVDFNKLKQQQSIIRERRIIKKDKTSMFIEVNGQTLSDGRIIGIYRDISFRKELQKKLEQSETYYKSLIEEQVDLVCRFSPDTTWTFVNTAYCIYWNRSTDELLGDKFINYLPESDKENIKYFLRSFTKEHSVRTMENLTKSNTGELRWHLWTYKAFFDENENIVEFQTVGKDITTQKNFEARLKASEELHRLVLSNISDAVILTNLNGNFTYVSPNSEILFSYSANEIYSMGQIKNLLGENLFSFKELNFYGELKDVEKTVTDKSGKVHHLLINIKRVNINTDEILYTCRDLTEYKSAIMKLALAEHKYQSIFDNALEGIYQVDLNGKIISANRSLAEILGYNSPQDLINTVNDYWTEVFVDSSLKPMIIAEMEKNNKIRGLEFEAYKKNGEIIWVLIYARNIRDKNGISVMYEGNMIDITRRKKAEKLLKKSEIRLQLSIEAANQGIWDWNIEKNEVYFSPKYYTMLGYKPNEFEANYDNWKDLIHPAQMISVAKHQKEIIKQEDQFSQEFLMRTKSGEYRWILSQGKVFGRDENENPLRVAGTHLDITEKKLADEKLKQSEENLRALSAHLEKIREEERKEIASLVHDELGQALTGIKLISLSISKNISGENEKAKLKLKEMNNIISSTIKSVQRISSNLRPKILETMGLIPAIEENLKIFSERTGIKSKIFIGKNSDLKFSENISVVLFRIFQESITNVARHANATEVKIKTALIKKHYYLEIIDNGIGIDEDKLNDPECLGIIGMQEKAIKIGGTLEIKRNILKGTTVKACLPSSKMNDYLNNSYIK